VLLGEGEEGRKSWSCSAQPGRLALRAQLLGVTGSQSGAVHPDGSLVPGVERGTGRAIETLIGLGGIDQQIRSPRLIRRFPGGGSPKERMML
jgi:hypothetical protein